MQAMNENAKSQNNGAPLLPHDPKAALQAIAQMANTLIDFADEETQVLIKDDWISFSSMQGSKERLAERYAQACHEFQTRIEDFRGSDQRMLNRLDALQKELGEKMQSNNVLIEQMHHRAMGNTHKTLLAVQEIAQDVHVRWPDNNNEADNGQ